MQQDSVCTAAAALLGVLRSPGASGDICTSLATSSATESSSGRVSCDSAGSACKPQPWPLTADNAMSSASVGACDRRRRSMDDRSGRIFRDWPALMLQQQQRHSLDMAALPPGLHQLRKPLTTSSIVETLRQQMQRTGNQRQSDKAAAEELVLFSLIGRGGYGSVYKGTWRGTPAAIKVRCTCARAYIHTHACAHTHNTCQVSDSQCF
jgi:hypothetical protein